MSSTARLLALILFLASFHVVAQEVISSEKYYDERLRAASPGALTDALFGDSISLKDGSFEFSHDDVVVPTNSGLRVAFGRQTPKHPQGLDRDAMPMGSAWEINAPYMVGRYDTRRGWTADASTQRCSSRSFPPAGTIGPPPDYSTRVMPPKMFWSGISINIPGAGYESLLSLAPHTALPSDGATYVGATSGQWRVSCLGSLKNGEGEGFIVRLPNGEKYFFDWMAIRDAPDLLANEYYQDDKGNGTAPPYLLVPTSDVFLFATRVEDRFGNAVTYQYDAAHPLRLVSIQSNEGARIDIDYDSLGKVAAVRAGERTWRYRYRQVHRDQSLSEVELPDGSRWEFGGDVMIWKLRAPPLPASFYMNSCGKDAAGFRQSDAAQPGYTRTLIMRHPAGATGTFKARGLIHGSDNTPGGCGILGTGMTNFSFGSHGTPDAYLAMSLVDKTITGVGGVDLSWTYTYTPSWSFQNNCAQGCRTTTSVRGPTGVVTEYIYGNSYTDNLGDLLEERVFENGRRMQTTRYFRKGSTGDFPEFHGLAIAPDENPLKSKIRPVQTTEIRRDGMTFTRTIHAFDAFARPLRVVRTGAVE